MICYLIYPSLDPGTGEVSGHSDPTSLAGADVHVARATLNSLNSDPTSVSTFSSSLRPNIDSIVSHGQRNHMPGDELWPGLEVCTRSVTNGM